MGVRISLDEIRADEFQALVVLEEEQDKWEKLQIESRGR